MGICLSDRSFHHFTSTLRTQQYRSLPVIRGRGDRCRYMHKRPSPTRKPPTIVLCLCGTAHTCQVLLSKVGDIIMTSFKQLAIPTALLQLLFGMIRIHRLLCASGDNTPSSDNDFKPDILREQDPAQLTALFGQETLNKMFQLSAFPVMVISFRGDQDKKSSSLGVLYNIVDVYGQCPFCHVPTNSPLRTHPTHIAIETSETVGGSLSSIHFRDQNHGKQEKKQ